MLRESERIVEIQKHNKILFDKLIDIGRRPHFSVAQSTDISNKLTNLKIGNRLTKLA